MKVAKIRQGEKREGRQQIIADFRRHEHDSGSPDVQVALLTNRILSLTEHLKSNKKDFHSRHGLLKMVAQRNRHLEYLRRTDFERYKALIGKLGLRK